MWHKINDKPKEEGQYLVAYIINDNPVIEIATFKANLFITKEAHSLLEEPEY